MKKLYVILPLFLLLCGCTAREIDRGYLVNSVGFSTKNGDTTIYIEAISSPDTLDNPSERVVLTSSGVSVQNAFDNLKKTLVKPLYFEQLGTIVFEKQINDSAVNFLKSLPDVNYGIYLVKTDDINSLFAASTPNGILGYDIIGLLKTNKENDNRLYRIGHKDFSLPTVNFENEELQIIG